MTVLQPPKNFGPSKIKDFLTQAEFIFNIDKKSPKDFTLDLHKMNSIKLPGQLLIYKFISYTAINQCFKNPKIIWHREPTIEQEFKDTGFLELINTHINNPKNNKEILKAYKALKFKSERNFMFHPTRLLRDEVSKRSKFESAFINKVVGFYEHSKAVDIIGISFSELVSNFWAHATLETNTVIVAKGNKSSFEICIADNGNGVISTLSDNKEIKDKEKLLLSSVEKGVTSKYGTSHMGYGLYLVKLLAQHNNGTLDIYSEGYYISVSKNGISSGSTGYWRGTIINFNVDLNNPKSISDCKEIEYDDSILINWGK